MRGIISNPDIKDKSKCVEGRKRIEVVSQYYAVLFLAT